MPDPSELIQALSREYDQEDGFLGQLRSGVFDPNGLRRLEATLASIQLSDAEFINRRLVALLWLIPTIMSWQLERVAEQGGNTKALSDGINRVQGRLYDVLGAP